MSHTGARCVYRNPSDTGKPYVAHLRRQGKWYHIGFFATVEDGAAAVAAFNAEHPRPYQPRDPKTGQFLPSAAAQGPA